MQGEGASEEAFEGEGGAVRGQNPLEVIGERLRRGCDLARKEDDFDFYRLCGCGGQVWNKLVEGKDGDLGGLGLMVRRALFSVMEVREVLGRHTKVELIG